MVWCVSRSRDSTTTTVCPGATAATAVATSTDAVVAVTIDNYVRAQSDQYFSNCVAQGGFGKLIHQVKPTSLDNQTVIRMNRDTLYTAGVFDMNAGTVTIVKPPSPDGRFQSMAFINEDNSVLLVHNDSGVFQLLPEQAETRYCMILFRTFVNPYSQEDVVKANTLQFMIQVHQDGVGSYAVPNWDPTSMAIVRAAVNVLAGTCSNTNDFFGAAWNMNPIYHLMGTASGWGGSPKYESMYFSGIVANNDGTTAYTLVMNDVPIRSGGFWSVTVYNADGYMQAGDAGEPSYNSVTAIKNSDGGVTIAFGGLVTTGNYIPIYPGWNYVVRCYLPEEVMYNGCWTPPAAVEVEDDVEE